MIYKRQLVLLSILCICFFSPTYYYGLLIVPPLILISLSNRGGVIWLKIISYLLILSIIPTFSWLKVNANINIDFVRDVFYLYKLILVFLIGGLFVDAKFKFEQYYGVIVLSAILFCAYYWLKISLYTLSNGNPFTMSTQAFRVEFGAGEFLVGFSLLIINKLRITFFFKIVLYVVLTLSFLVFQSRTMIMLPLLFLAFKFILVRGRLSYKRVCAVVMLFSLAVALVFNANFGESDENDFYNKIANSATEIGPSNYETMHDIGTNWRGYEAFWALSKFINADAEKKLLGFGYGSKIELPIVMKLGGQYYSELPFIHNGYLLILIKSGVLGLVIFVFWHLSIFSLARKNLRNSDQSLFLLTLCSFSLFSTFFMSGVFEANDWAALLVIFGMLYANVKSTRTI